MLSLPDELCNDAFSQFRTRLVHFLRPVQEHKPNDFDEERSLFEIEQNAIQRKLTEANRAVSRLKDAVARALCESKKNCIDLASDIRLLQQSLDAANEALKEEKEFKTTLAEKIDLLEAELRKDQEGRRTTVDLIESLQKENISLVECRKELDTSKSALESACRTSSELRERVVALQTELDGYKAQVTSLQDALEQLKATKVPKSIKHETAADVQIPETLEGTPTPAVSRFPRSIRIPLTA